MHQPRRARVSWLRHAYLALFAVAGYRYIFLPGLGVVRKQIKEPDAEHIPLFLAALPEHRPWTEKRIIYVRKPQWLSSPDSLEEYLLIAQDRARVEKFMRQDDGVWLFVDAASLAPVVPLVSVGCELSLAAAYEGIELSS